MRDRLKNNKKAVFGPFLRRIGAMFVDVFRSIDAVMRGRAVEAIEYEIAELDNLFGLMVMGSFIGIPAPPIHVTMALLPVMHKEMVLMLDKVATAHDPLGDLFSVLQID